MSYDTKEAARLISWSNRQAGIEPLTEAELIRWIDDGVGLLEWSDVLEEDGEIHRYIDFPTLISIRMICLLRYAKISLKDIAGIATLTRDKVGLNYPFASRFYWDLSSDGSISTIAAIGEAADAVLGALIALFEDIHSQGQLDFDENGMACAWRPVDAIKIDPRFVSGSPCLAGTRIPTWIFPGMVRGGDNLGAIAEDYSISEEQVDIALEWEKQLASAKI